MLARKSNAKQNQKERCTVKKFNQDRGRAAEAGAAWGTSLGTFLGGVVGSVIGAVGGFFGGTGAS